MSTSETLQLDIWKGDWGLPSSDISCLQVLAYAKMCKVPLKIRATNDPYNSPNGQLPVLRSGSTTLGNVSEILQFLEARRDRAERTLSPKERADAMAYRIMLEEKVQPALQYIWWLDKKNLEELVRPWYANALSFPFNFYYPKKWENRAKDLMASLYPTENESAIIETKVYSEAQKCLTILSARLGSSEYFFGSSPSILDAIVYSYLAPLLKMPLANAALQNHAKNCPNLLEFTARVSQRFFVSEQRDYETTKMKEKARRDSDGEFSHKRRDQILAVLFAALAMLAYAFSNGIVEVSVKEDHLEEPLIDDIYDQAEDDR